MEENSAADNLRSRMQALRSDVSLEMERTIANARAALDWRRFVAFHPWLCLGAATAVGYLLVPKRSRYVQPTPEALAELARARHVTLMPQQAAQGNMTGSVLGIVANAIARRAVAAAVDYTDQLLRARAERHHGSFSGKVTER